jgi:hypothetical protein
VVQFSRLTPILFSSVLALAALANTGSTNEVKSGAVAKPYSVVLKTPIIIDSLTSKSVCGKTLDGKSRLCAGPDIKSQFVGDSVSHLKSFIAGGTHFCGVDERGVRCWQTDGKFEKPIQKILESGAYDRARLGYDRVCVPQKDLTIHCYQPDRQRWVELPNGGSRYEFHQPPMESYGPYSELRDFQVLDNELCALDGEAIRCVPLKNLDPDVKFTPRVVFPKGPFVGARSIAGTWNSLCVLSDAGLSCAFGREPAEAKHYSAGNEWTKASQLSNFGYDGFCAHSATGQPLCIRYDSSKYTITDPVPEDYKRPEIRIKKFDVGNDRLCAMTEEVATGKSAFSCLIYSSVTDIPFMKDIVDFKVTSDSVCGIDRNQRVHCTTNNYHRPVPLPEDGSEIRSAGSCRWNDSRFHCSNVSTETDFSNIKKVIAASQTEGDEQPCIIFENHTGIRSVRCFGSQESLGSQAPVLEPEMNKITATYGTICLYGGLNFACWGAAIGGEPVPNLNSVQKVLFSRDFACAKDQFGFLCWGRDIDSRQLTVPKNLADIDSIKDFALGESHICVLTRDNQVECWGSNSSGQLDVPTLTNPVSIAVNGKTTCASSDEGVTCWGDREESLNQ